MPNILCSGPPKLSSMRYVCGSLINRSYCPQNFFLMKQIGHLIIGQKIDLILLSIDLSLIQFFGYFVKSQIPHIYKERSKIS